MKVDLSEKCKHCGKQRGHHNAKTVACPQGRRHPVVGYTSYHPSQCFEGSDRATIRVPVDWAVKNLNNNGSSENSWSWDLEAQGANYHFTVGRDFGKRVVFVHGAAGHAEEIGKFTRKSGLDAMFRALKISVAWLVKHEAEGKA